MISKHARRKLNIKFFKDMLESRLIKESDHKHLSFHLQKATLNGSRILTVQVPVTKWIGRDCQGHKSLTSSKEQ